MRIIKYNHSFSFNEKTSAQKNLNQNWIAKNQKKNLTKSQKRDELTLIYSEKLNGLIESFYSSLSSSDESNQENFDLLDKEWKKMCYTVNRTCSYMDLPSNAFEKTIIRNRMISKIHELEPKLPGDYLYTLHDAMLEKMVDDKSNRDFILNEYQKTIPDTKSNTITLN